MSFYVLYIIAHKYFYVKINISWRIVYGIIYSYPSKSKATFISKVLSGRRVWTTKSIGIRYLFSLPTVEKNSWNTSSRIAKDPNISFGSRFCNFTNDSDLKWANEKIETKFFNGVKKQYPPNNHPGNNPRKKRVRLTRMYNFY